MVVKYRWKQDFIAMELTSQIQLCDISLVNKHTNSTWNAILTLWNVVQLTAGGANDNT